MSSQEDLLSQDLERLCVSNPSHSNEDVEDADDGMFGGMDGLNQENDEQQQQQEVANEEEGGHSSSAEEADDMTCAICLERTPLTEIALVKGCEHQYCVNCILQWSLCKEWCPQCKHPFDYLLTHKQLDGTLTDFLTEESVVLLKRARWFEDYMRTSEKGKATLAMIQSRGSSNGTLSAALAAAGSGVATDAAVADAAAADARDWADLYEDYLDAELEEDEEYESFYFSSAAGRARVVLGNRRWGEGGFMRAGRMYARPVAPTRTPNAAGGKAGASSSKAAGKGSSSSTSSGGASSSKQAAAAAAGAAGASSSSGAGSSSSAAAAAAAGSSNGYSTGSSSRGRQVDRSAASASSVAPWLDDQGVDDDDDDFTIYESSGYNRGSGSGGSSSNRQCERSSSSGSRSRARMIKPQRKVPKGAAVSPAVASAAACAVVNTTNTPLGKSPGNAGSFHVGSWGVAGKSPNSGGGWAAMAAAGGLGGSTPGTAGSSAQAAAGSAPGSGRRARRNARRAALDAGDCD